MQTKLLKRGAKTGLINTRQWTGRLDKPNMVKTAVELSGQRVGSHNDVGMLGQATGAKEPSNVYVSTDSIALVRMIRPLVRLTIVMKLSCSCDSLVVHRIQTGSRHDAHKQPCKLSPSLLTQ
jgi:hypothetical protein